MHLFFSDPDLNITKILYGQSGIFDQFGVRINLVKPKLIISSVSYDKLIISCYVLNFFNIIYDEVQLGFYTYAIYKRFQTVNSNFFIISST